MSWGIKITILYLSFVALIVTMVGMSMNQKIDLDTTEYYEKELHYQSRINAINRTQALKEPMDWQIEGKQLLLKFPGEMKGGNISGSIYFFRPSDAALDRKIPLASDTTLQRSIPIHLLQKGVYKMQIDWENGHEQYYNESIIQVQ